MARESNRQRLRLTPECLLYDTFTIGYNRDIHPYLQRFYQPQATFSDSLCFVFDILLGSCEKHHRPNDQLGGRGTYRRKNRGLAKQVVLSPEWRLIQRNQA